MKKIEKVALTNKAGKTVEFPIGQVDYMTSHGWSKAGEPEQEPDTEVDADIDTMVDSDVEPDKTSKRSKSRK